MFELKGNIKLINDTMSFQSGFTKREFVVTTEDNQYPQDIKFELVKDKCSLLDNYGVGEPVHVHFDIRGNEYNGKYFVNLNCWKLLKQDSQAQAGAHSSEQVNPEFEPSTNDLREDDIPF